MPTYQPNVGYEGYTKVAISGRPAYFYGSLAEDQQDTLAQVTSVACASDVATIGITIQQGNVPVVGNLLWVQGTVNASGAYNVNGVAIASVTAVNAALGEYTLTYACTTANLGTTAAAGKAIVPVQEVAETLAANQSIAWYVPSQEPQDHGLRNITVATIFPTLPTAVTVTLYTAMKNDPLAPGTAGSEWTSMGVVATVAASAQTVGPLVTFTTPAGRWFCLVASALTGTGTIISKFLY